MSRKHSLWIMMLLTGLVACSTGGKRDDTPMNAWEAELRAPKTGDARQKTDDLPPEVLQALMPSSANPLQAQRKPTKPGLISWDTLHSTPARAFFLSLVEGTDRNMVVHPGVVDEIPALHLKDVTMEEAMDVVRQMNGYEYKFLPNGYQVLPAPKGLQTRIFKLDYLNMVRRGRSGIRVSSGEISQGGGSSGSGGSPAAPAAPAAPSQPGGPSGQGGQTRMNNDILTNTDSDFWQELEDTLGMIIGCPVRQASNQIAGGGQVQALSGDASQTSSPCRAGATPQEVRQAPTTGVQVLGEGGQAPPAAEQTAQSQDHKILAVNRNTGVVIVRALPEEIRAIEDFVRMTKNSVTRQVILEAKIMEVQLSDDFQSGINWAVLGKVATNKISAQQTGGGPSTIFRDTPFGPTDTSTGTLNPNSVSAVAQALAAAAPMGGLFTLALHAKDIEALVTLLQTQGNVQVLSNPRIATLNNQKAIIKVGSEEYFVTGVQSTNTQGAGGNQQSQNIPLAPFFSGIALDVTPQIDDAGGVTLHIHPVISDVTNQTKSFTIGGEANTVNLALSNVRESDSIVRARNGQLVVIGGMMKDESTDRTASNPLLSNLPLLGPLFRHSLQQNRKSELVILLRPTIVDMDKTWDDETSKVGDRIQGHREEMDQRNDDKVYTFGRMR